MNFFKGFFKGIGNCFKGFSIIFEKGLWPYMLYPLILWALLWMGGIMAAGSLASWIADALTEQVKTMSDDAWYSFLKPVLLGHVGWLITLVIKLVFWFISGTFAKYLLLILLSPLFALLSESTEEKLSGKKFPFSFGQLIKDIFRGIGISLRNMCIEYAIVIGCFVLTLFVPVLAFITVPFLMLVSWYFFGFTMLDYNFERHRMNISKSAQFARRNRGLACGIGLVYAFFISLPTIVGDVAGLMLGPVLAVVGATVSFMEIREREQQLAASVNTPSTSPTTT